MLISRGRASLASRGKLRRTGRPVKSRWASGRSVRERSDWGPALEQLVNVVGLVVSQVFDQEVDVVVRIRGVAPAAVPLRGRELPQAPVEMVAIAEEGGPHLGGGTGRHPFELHVVFRAVGGPGRVLLRVPGLHPAPQ